VRLRATNCVDTPTRRSHSQTGSSVAQGVKGDEEYAGVKPIEEHHRIDEASLDRWMHENVEHYVGPLNVLQFKGGQSNPTYRVDTPGASYVVRRKPFGKLLPSAHAVDREFRIISTLHKQGFPVARPCALCMSDEVIGSAFYVMSMEAGRVFWDPTLQSQLPQDRRLVFTDKIQTLARLHIYDPDEIGLGDFGKPGNYFARQIDRWTKQYRASALDVIPNESAHRVATAYGAAAGKSVGSPWRLPPRQYDIPPGRASRYRRPGLGALHAWGSDGRFHLLADAMGDGGLEGCRSRAAQYSDD
jgi:hypothetical protein